jgi:peroxiredoxin
MYDQFKEAGVDEVYCTSVNDTFVMNAWFEQQGIEKVKPLPDGNGELARQLGLLVKKENLGFGLRSWRYAMLVSEGSVELLSIEPNLQDNCKTDPYEKSKPEVFLEEIKSHFGLNFPINEDESVDSDSQTEE